VPIKALTAAEWTDDESDLAGDWLDGAYDEADTIVAPAIGKLTIKGAKGGPAGDFQADLTLNEDGAAATPAVLGPVKIAGQLAQATWTIYGDAGDIAAGEKDPSWSLTVDTGVRATTIYNKRTFTLDEGAATVAFAVTGGGALRITPDDGGTVDFTSLEILNPTAKTKVMVTAKGRAITIGDIHADGSLASILAAAVTLTGDLTVEGDLAGLTLGDVGGDVATEQKIEIQGSGAVDPGSGVTITLGNVRDLQLDSALPVKSLRLGSWLDTADSDADGIVAPAIDRLIAIGNFQADLTLNEDGTAPKAVVLGSARVVGAVSGATWSIYGAAGLIQGADGGDWIRNIDGSFRTTTVYNSRTFDLGDGRMLTLGIVGGGTLTVVPDESGDADVASITVDDPTLRTRVTARTIGGAVAVAEVTSIGSLSAITAPGVTLTGDLTVLGALNTLVLGDVGGAERAEQAIRISGASSNPRAGVSITLGSVADLRIHSDMPIKSLTAVEWSDDETEWDGGEDWADSEYSEVDAVIAPSLGKLTVRPPKGRADGGDFQADLDLNSEYTATTTTVLGSARIAGTLDEAVWLVTDGDTGHIAVSEAADDWTLDVDGSVKSVAATGDLGGELTADFFGAVAAGGAITADITATSRDNKGRSLGLLKADAVDDIELDVQGRIQTIHVGQWTGGSILADAIGAVIAKPGKGSAAAGEFSPDMTVTGPVGAMNIRGDATGSWAATAIKSVAVGGDADELYLYVDRAADAKGRKLGLGKLTVTGRLSDSRILAAGNIGSVTVGAMENTDAYAGYIAATLDTVMGLPAADEMNNIILFDALATIKSLTVKGLKDDSGEYVDSFVASNIGAAKLGAVNLAYAALDDASPLFGATGHTLRSYSYRDADGVTRWSARNNGGLDQPEGEQNLVIRLV